MGAMSLGPKHWAPWRVEEEVSRVSTRFNFDGHARGTSLLKVDYDRGINTWDPVKGAFKRQIRENDSQSEQEI